MRYEMQNFIKFANSKKPSNVGQKPKRAKYKLDRKLARKQKQVTRQLAN